MIADSDAYFKDDRWYTSADDDTTYQQYLRHDTVNLRETVLITILKQSFW